MLLITNNINFKSLNLKHSLRLLLKLFDKENESKLWDLYISVYPNMDKNTFVTFDKFKKQVTKKENDTKTNEKKLDNIRDIVNNRK